MKPLNRTTVANLPKRPIRVVQFGEGNFLRAFVDWMIDVLNEKSDFNGDVAIVQPIPKGMGKPINQQDGLYHVLLEGIQNGKTVQDARMISCVRRVIEPYEEYQIFLKLAENPQLEFIVSNTTEAGITFEEEAFLPKEPATTFPGKLTAFLWHRYQFFNENPPQGLVVLPCELIDKNGSKLRECILNYAAHWKLSDGFVAWVQIGVVFCDTLVDRIVPGFPKATIDSIQENIGYQDQLVVKAEPFHLWVIKGPKEIEEKFPFKKAGLNVILTDDLEAYRTRKVRILNGAHTAMVPYGYLHGLEQVREVVEDKTAGNFIRDIIFQEIIPTLDLPKSELETYASEVLERFQNPFVKHLLLDISLNSIAKFKVRVLPSILEYQKRFGQPPSGLMKAFAHLLVFYKGEQDGEKIPLRDDAALISLVQNAWKMEDLEETLLHLLSNEKLFGLDLSIFPELKKALFMEIRNMIT